MGGKRGKKGESNGAGSSGFHTNMSIREEASGKKQSHNPKSLLKLNHLQNLAVWASGQSKVADFGTLGAYFGRSFADLGESMGIPPDPSLFPCQRCETILQPGSNCTVRIEKNEAKRHRRSKVRTPAQNNAVYTCHFCSHRNLKRGTPKGYVKELVSSRVIPSKNESVSSAVQKGSTAERSSAGNATTMVKANAAPSSAVSSVITPLTSSVASPPANLLDSKRRKRKKPGPKGSSDEALVSSAPAQIEKAGGTSRKRRKAWTTLKDIAEDEEREKNKRFSNFSIPFLL